MLTCAVLYVLFTAAMNIDTILPEKPAIIKIEALQKKRKL